MIDLPVLQDLYQPDNGLWLPKRPAIIRHADKELLAALAPGLIFGGVQEPAGYVDVAVTTAPSGAPSHDVNMPTRVPGDLLILRISGSGGFAPPSFPGWTLLTPNATASGHIFYRTAVGAGDVFQDSGGPALFVVWSFHGTTGAPVYAGTGQTSSSPNPPPLTSGFGSVPTLWMAMYGGGLSKGDVTAYPSGYTTGQSTYAYNYSGSNWLAYGSAFQLLTAASEDPGVFTAANSIIWTAYTIAIKMA